MKPITRMTMVCPAEPNLCLYHVLYVCYILSKYCNYFPVDKIRIQPAICCLLTLWSCCGGEGNFIAVISINVLGYRVAILC